jgi:hypothetical protein
MSSGIQNNTTEYQIDVTYTKLGRQYRAQGSPLARITKFALSDDGINYNLISTSSDISNKYIKLERTPQFDTWTDSQSLMKSLLFTTPANQPIINTFSVDRESIDINPVSFGSNYFLPLTSNYGLRFGLTVTLDGAINDNDIIDEEITFTLTDNEYLFITRQNLTTAERNKASVARKQGESQTISFSNLGETRVATVYLVYSSRYNGLLRIPNSVYNTSIRITNKSGYTKEIPITLQPV